MSSVYDQIPRIITGELIFSFGGSVYKLTNPNARTRYEAQIIYEDTVKKNRFGDFISKEDCLRILINNDLCSPAIDSNLKQIDNRIEELKIDLYEALKDSKMPQVKKARDMLEKVKEKQFDMISKRHMFDSLTLGGYAEMIKRQYLIYSTLHDVNGNRIWTDFDNVDTRILEGVLSYVNANMLSQSDLRLISRNDPWRTYWNLSDGNPFETPPIDFNEEQKVLVLFSRMYDSVYEHPEHPSEEIIDDDDALDGWLAAERKKREKENTKKEIDKRSGKASGADEVFIPVSSRKEAKKINDYNNIEGKLTKIKRKKFIEANGVVADHEFPDKKLAIQMEAVNSQTGVKGKK